MIPIPLIVRNSLKCGEVQHRHCDFDRVLAAPTHKGTFRVASIPISSKMKYQPTSQLSPHKREFNQRVIEVMGSVNENHIELSFVD
jgi:hypothetical protein